MSAGDRRLLRVRALAGPLPWAVAVIAALATLALAGALALRTVAFGLGDGLARRATIEIATADAAAREGQAAQALRRLRADPGVRAAERVGPAQLDRLLAPWLGPAASRVLPLPALIDVELADAAAVARLPAAVAGLPAARVERHDAALAPLAGLVGTLRLIAAALLALMAGALVAVVALAARGAIGSHRETVALLHQLGAEDEAVARLFARRLALDATIGAAVGAGAAVPVILLIGGRAAALDAGLAGLALPGWGWMAALPLPVAAAAAIGWLTTRASVRRALARTP